jgi:hypothetical protein
MGTAYPPERKREFPEDQERLDESLLRDEDDGDHDPSDDVLTLLEENARLRGLVIKLSDIILKNVAERK